MSYPALFSSIAASLNLQRGLSLRGVLENIPTDPASIFVYLLLAASVGLIVRGSRGKGTPSGGRHP